MWNAGLTASPAIWEEESATACRSTFEISQQTRRPNPDCVLDRFIPMWYISPAQGSPALLNFNPASRQGFSLCVQEKCMHLETALAQTGTRSDPSTGAVSPPIYPSSTFQHPSLGNSTGFDYSRTANPTRAVLEHAIASLEHGHRGFAFASGMAAIAAVVAIFKPGDHIIASEDLYGGTYRLFETIARTNGLHTSYVDTSDITNIDAACSSATRAIFLETPTNPTMKITSLHAAVANARTRGMLCIVDNTFMTPFLQRPIEIGADIVLHSATKYLGGHNDVIAGLVVTRERRNPGTV
jgi:cystathionine gamma-synthase